MSVLDWLYKKPKPKPKKGDKTHPKGSAARAGEDVTTHQAATKKRADCALKGKEYDATTGKCV